MERPTTSTHGILAPANAGPGGRFSLTRLPPSDDLAPWVERHWIVRWKLAPEEAFVQEVLPHPCVNLVADPDEIAVHGIPRERYARPLSGSGMAVGTKFRPGGFAAFTGLRADRLRGRALPLGDAFGADGEAIERELAACFGDAPAHLAVLEAFLRARRPEPDPRFELVRAAVGDMLDGAAPTVEQLAERRGVSPRTLQRLFGAYVGVSPKWVLKRYRVHEAAERIAADEAGDGAALAYELGYADQSHLIREFTAQIGCSPTAYAQACAAARGPAEPAGARAA